MISFLGSMLGSPYCVKLPCSVILPVHGDACQFSEAGALGQLTASVLRNSKPRDPNSPMWVLFTDVGAQCRYLYTWIHREKVKILSADCRPGIFTLRMILLSP